MKKTFLVQVQGRVQGVGFRYYTEQQANRLGITGWVRNCSDGSVEVLICGDESQTKAMLSWLKHGPPSASVRDINVKKTNTPAGLDFRVTYTY